MSGSDVPRPGLAQHPPIMHKRTSTAAPITLDRTLAMCEWLFPAQTLEAGRYDVADAVALFSRVNEQDFAAAQWCQPNMSSRAYARGGVLVPSEAPVISRYYEWYLGLMEEACPSTTE